MTVPTNDLTTDSLDQDSDVVPGATFARAEILAAVQKLQAFLDTYGGHELVTDLAPGTTAQIDRDNTFTEPNTYQTANNSSPIVFANSGFTELHKVFDDSYIQITAGPDENVDAGIALYGNQWGVQARGVWIWSPTGKNIQIDPGAGGRLMSNGNDIATVLKTTHTFSTWNNLQPGSRQQLSVSLPGVTSLDTIIATPRGTLHAGGTGSFVWNARAETDTVYVDITNAGNAAGTPSTVAWSIMAIRY